MLESKLCQYESGYTEILQARQKTSRVNLPNGLFGRPARRAVWRVKSCLGWGSKGNRLIRLKSQSINQFYNLNVQGVGIDGTVTSSTQNSSPVIGSINLRPSTRFKPLGIVPGVRKFTVV